MSEIIDKIYTPLLTGHGFIRDTENQQYGASGEELSPYRRLSAGCIKTFIGGYTPYKALIHKNIPIRSIGIEIAPAYLPQNFFMKVKLQKLFQWLLNTKRNILKKSLQTFATRYRKHSNSCLLFERSLCF